MICARAAVYASPVLRIRARTRRLRSLLRGIVVSPWVHHGPLPSSAPMVDAKNPTIAIRRYALLCLALDSGSGRVFERFGADRRQRQNAQLCRLRQGTTT